MSIRDHINRASGKKVRFRRMPPEINMGGRIHNDDLDNEEKAEQCACCGKWFGSMDLEQDLCFDCYKSQKPKESVDEESAP